MRKTVWLLDVDGVINARRAGWGRAAVHHHVCDSEGTSWRMTFEPKLLEFVREVADRPDAEVVWSTTWCGSAHVLEELWELPELRRAFTVPAGKYTGDLKLQAVRAELAQGNRVIWTDDTEVPDVAGSSRDVALHIELMMSRRALLIRPDGRRGLRPADMLAIRDFLEAGR